MEEELRILLALWQDRLVTADQVVRWADRHIESSDARSLPTWLIELSLHGPVACFKNPSIEFPTPAELSFLDRFAIRAVSLDPSSTRELEAFVAWTTRAAMGEDLELAEVRLSYQLDHLANDCDRMDQAVEELRKELPRLRETLRERAASLLSCV